MTKSKMSRYALLRTLAVVPVVALLICVFSCTTKTAEAKAVNFGSGVESVYGNPAAGELSDAASAASQKDDKAYMSVDTVPRFQDGDLNDFRNWVMSQIHYPDETIKSGKSGRVIVQFIVEKDGSVDNVTLLESFDKAAGEECLRVVKSSPKWTPGVQDGKYVRVKYVIPVQFATDGGDAEE